MSSELESKMKYMLKQMQEYLFSHSRTGVPICRHNLARATNKYPKYGVCSICDPKLVQLKKNRILLRFIIILYMWVRAS